MKNWVALTMVAALTGTALAQTESSTKKKPPVKQSQKTQELEKPAVANVAKPAPLELMKAAPFKPPVIKFTMAMLESGRIDPGYVGFAAADVIEALEKMTVSKKGEFESTADYNARKAVALASKFLGDLSVNDVFAFMVPVPKGGKYRDGLGYEFNADTSSVNLYALPTSSQYLPLNGIGAPDYQTNRRESKGLDQFKLSTKIESQSTYQGSNAYGATISVEKTLMSTIGIAANRIPFLKFERDLGYSNPTVATQLKNGKLTGCDGVAGLEGLDHHEAFRSLCCLQFPA